LTTTGAEILERGLGGEPVRRPDVARGRDIVLRAQILGEALRSFELGRDPVRPEHAKAHRPQIVGEPVDQRRLGPDDDQLDECS
jgi:hypothetical protein